jgi:hypothetical protein
MQQHTIARATTPLAVGGVSLEEMPTAGDVSWVAPPPAPDGEHSLWVDFRLDLTKLANVNTVDGTAFYNGYVIMYWTDTRLIGWEGELPQDLWGPKLICGNGKDMDISPFAFVLANRSTGRLKRAYVYTVRQPA